jgi:oxygen-independent coproporphyrinogen-3 oxidase
MTDFFSEPASIRALKGFGIYLHFPYCVQKCSYCDFHSTGLGGDSVAQGDLRRYFNAIEEELNFRLDRFSSLPVTSIYFGGGTASLLPVGYVAELLSLFSKHLPFEDPEITLEGNPEQLTAPYLAGIAGAGINRVHAGIQSFHPGSLTALNRHFDPVRYAAIIDDLASSPISNWGIDLMYGIPGQSRSQFIEDLERAVGANPSHLSLYSLTVEEETPYARRIERGVAKPPAEVLQGDLFEALPSRLADSGYRQYEVSNYARPGYESRHNLQYWLYRPYLGLGPGAHGFTGTERYSNKRLPVREGRFSIEYEPHNPSIELPLGFLRITVPFRINRFVEMIRANGLVSDGTYYTNIVNLFNTWIKRGFAVRADGDLFQWNGEGLKFLDDRVSEMVEILELPGDELKG